MDSIMDVMTIFRVFFLFWALSQLRCLHPIYLIIFLVLINKERNGCINFFILFAISLLDLINLPFYWFAGNKNGLLLPHTTTDQGDSYFFMFVLIFSTYNVIWPCYNDFVTPFLPKQKFTLLTLWIKYVKRLFNIWPMILIAASTDGINKCSFL